MSENTQKPSHDESFFNKHGLFAISLIVSIVVAVWGVLSPEDLGKQASDITSSALESLDWFFLAVVTSFVLLCFYLAIGPYGKIKLGKDDDDPEFSLPSWLAMLFAAGMGVGLLFWGVSEPVIHFIEPTGLQGHTPAAARQSMVLTCFHWGLHAWAIYAVTALVLAYFGFRKGTRYLPGEPIRMVFTGKWVSPVAKAADIIAVLAVSLGVAGSLGMGLMQISSGVKIVGGITGDPLWLPVTILICLVTAYMTSASTGLSKGIQLLSNINMWLAVILMLFVLLTGPTVSLFGGFVNAVGDYSSSLVGLSFRLYPYQNLKAWTHRWTLTFFIFFIAWAPFVGVFIARISRGRTIREFILGVILVPTLFSIFWFSIFGGSAVYEEMHGLGGLSTLVKEDMTMALFTMFDRLPLSRLLSLTAISLIFIFLVTSADSATFVLSMLTSQGDPDPPTRKKIIWGVVLGALGAALMFTGSVDALQAVVVAGAIPFVFVMVLQLAALMKELRREEATKKKKKKKKTGERKRKKAIPREDKPIKKKRSEPSKRRRDKEDDDEASDSKQARDRRRRRREIDEDRDQDRDDRRDRERRSRDRDDDRDRRRRQRDDDEELRDWERRRRDRDDHRDRERDLEEERKRDRDRLKRALLEKALLKVRRPEEKDEEEEEDDLDDIEDIEDDEDDEDEDKR